MANKLHCPNCKSTNITITTESSVNSGVTAHHGTVSTTSVSNTHRNFWICSDCGTKFRNIQSLEEEIQKTKKTPIILGVIGLVGAIISILFLITGISAIAGNNPFGFMAILWFFGGMIVSSVFGIVALVALNKTNKMKKELAYLKEKCFD